MKINDIFENAKPLSDEERLELETLYYSDTERDIIIEDTLQEKIEEEIIEKHIEPERELELQRELLFTGADIIEEEFVEEEKSGEYDFSNDDEYIEEMVIEEKTKEQEAKELRDERRKREKQRVREQEYYNGHKQESSYATSSSNPYISDTPASYTPYNEDYYSNEYKEPDKQNNYIDNYSQSNYIENNNTQSSYSTKEKSSYKESSGNYNNSYQSNNESNKQNDYYKEKASETYRKSREEKRYEQRQAHAEKTISKVETDITRAKERAEKSVGGSEAVKSIKDSATGGIKTQTKEWFKASVSDDEDVKKVERETSEAAGVIYSSGAAYKYKNQLNKALEQNGIDLKNIKNTDFVYSREGINNVVNTRLNSIKSDIRALSAVQVQKELKVLNKIDKNTLTTSALSRMSELKEYQSILNLKEQNKKFWDAKSKKSAMAKMLISDLLDSSGDTTLESFASMDRNATLAKNAYKTVAKGGHLLNDNFVKPTGAFIKKTTVNTVEASKKAATASSKFVKQGYSALKNNELKEFTVSNFKRAGTMIKEKNADKAGKKSIKFFKKGTSSVVKEGLWQSIKEGAKALAGKIVAVIGGALTSAVGIFLIMFIVVILCFLMITTIMEDETTLQTYVDALILREEETGEIIDEYLAETREYDSDGNITNGGKYDEVVVEYVMGQEAKNIKDILSMMTIRFEQDFSDKNKINSYINNLYDDSHELVLTESEFYSCSGCKHKNVCDGHSEEIEIIDEMTGEVIDTYTRYYSHSDNDSSCDDYTVVYYCEGKHQDLLVEYYVYSLPTLFDLDTTSSNFPSSSWQGWTEENKEWCLTIYEQNWSELYPNLVGVESAMSGTPLSQEEINALLAELPSDLSSSRRAVINSALSAVGRIPYYWGGKPVSPNFADNNFGTTTVPDAHGRTLKGLDCSGFVKWVYWNAGMYHSEWSWTGDEYSTSSGINRNQLIPGDLGFQAVGGASTNHVGIYLGKNSNGSDVWIHCTAGTTNNVIVGTSSVFQLYRRPSGL